MTRITHVAAALLVGLFLVPTAPAADAISMPLPPGFGSELLSADEVSSLAAHLTASVATQAPSLASTPMPALASMEHSLFLEGVDALERYAARDGRTRNHNLHGNAVSLANFHAGVGVAYSGYNAGPWGGYGGWGGWGWWGPPIIVNNYCPTVHQGHRGGGVTACRSSFIGLATF